MKSIGLALGASLTWGFADFFGPLKGRTLGALRVLFYVQVGGLAAIALIVAVRGKGPADSAALFAVPVAFGIATGDRPSTWQWLGILAALAGVFLASREPGHGGKVAAGVGLALL